jgi:hypothetical protein
MDIPRIKRLLARDTVEKRRLVDCGDFVSKENEGFLYLSSSRRSELYFLRANGKDTQ